MCCTSTDAFCLICSFHGLFTCISKKFPLLSSLYQCCFILPLYFVCKHCTCLPHFIVRSSTDTKRRGKQHLFCKWAICSYADKDLVVESFSKNLWMDLEWRSFSKLQLPPSARNLYQITCNSFNPSSFMTCYSLSQGQDWSVKLNTFCVWYNMVLSLSMWPLTLCLLFSFTPYLRWQIDLIHSVTTSTCEMFWNR